MLVHQLVLYHILDLFYRYCTVQLLAGFFNIGKNRLNLVVSKLFIINDAVVCLADCSLDLADVKNVLAATSLNNLHNRSESFLLIAFSLYNI